MNSSSHILELGTGVAGVIALTLAPKIAHFYASDQEYCLRILQKNIDENSTSNHSQSKKNDARKHKHARASEQEGTTVGQNISVIQLDWETTSVKHIPLLQGCRLDAVIACDCIYNENLIKSFMETLVDACSISNNRAGSSKDGAIKPTVAIIAQELRSFDVMESFMVAFCEGFQVARIPDTMYKDMGVDDLKEGGGFVVHVGVLKTRLETI